MTLSLKEAARVFDFVVPEWLDGSAQIGKICGVPIYADEMRRLHDALAREEKLESIKLQDDVLRRDVIALLRDKKLIDAIRLVRTNRKLFLKEAKEYVEDIGIEAGLRQYTDLGYGNIHTWVQP